MDPFFKILLIGVLVLGGFGALHYFLRGRRGAGGGGYRRRLPVSGRFREADKSGESSLPFYLAGSTIVGHHDSGSSADCGSSHGGDGGGGCSDGGGSGGS